MSAEDLRPTTVSTRTTFAKIRDAIILTLASILLLLAQSAFWLNHTIFDKASFTSITNSVLLTDSTRQAVATTIVDQAFQDKPVLKRLIGNNMSALISGLLATDIATQATSAVVDRTYIYLTSNDPQPIGFDLLPLKTPLERIVSVVESQGRDVSFDVSNIPDSIILFDPKNLPDIYSASIMTLWLGPLAWIGATVLFGLYIYLRRTVYPRAVYFVGAAIIAVGAIGLLVGPLVRPPVVAMVSIPSLRSVFDQLIAALLQPFNQQMILMICLAVFVLIIFALRIHILHAAHWSLRKLSELASRQQPVSNPPASPPTPASKPRSRTKNKR